MIKQLRLKYKNNYIGNISNSVTFISNKYTESIKDSTSTYRILKINIFNEPYSIDSINFWTK